MIYNFSSNAKMFSMEEANGVSHYIPLLSTQILPLWALTRCKDLVRSKMKILG